MEIIDGNKFVNRDAPAFDNDYHRMATSESHVDAAIGVMMLNLLDALRAGVVGPRVVAAKFWRDQVELWLNYHDPTGNSTHVTVTVDFKDRSPLVDEVPLLHYRMSYTRPSPNASENTPTVELRTRDVGTAYEFVLEAIKQCKPAL